MTVDKSSHSEVEQFVACERRHYYSYGLKIQGTSTTDSLATGNVGHAALAAYYQALMLGASEDNAVDAAFDMVRQEMPKYDVYDPDKIRNKLTLLLGHYFDTYENEPIKVLEVELLHNIQLTSEYIMPVKLDLICELPPYGVLALDHKFTHDFYTADKVDLSPQLPKYFAALQALGRRVDGVWYNQLRTRDTKDNNADPKLKFERTPVPLTTSRVVVTMREQMMAARRISVLKSLPLVEWEQQVLRNPLHCQMCPFQLLCDADLNSKDSELILDSFYEPKEYK